MTRPILQFEGVSITYPGAAEGAAAVRGVSLELAPGETLGLVGESGSGKSSLALAIQGLLPPGARVTGRILFDGRDITAIGAEELRRLRGNEIATIFQDPFTALNPVKRIGRQLEEFQHWRGTPAAERRARAVEILASVGLSDPADRMRQFPHQLSGGIRQRVMIAAALLAEPRLMIADEPTTALDATTEAQIFEILATARRSLGGAMVFITHDIGSVARICERVAVLYGGELVESGPVRDVLENPAHPYTQALLECDPARIGTPTRHLPTIPGRVPRPDDLPSGCIFAPRCPEAIARCHCERPRPAALGEGWHAACHLAAP